MTMVMERLIAERVEGDDDRRQWNVPLMSVIFFSESDCDRLEVWRFVSYLTTWSGLGKKQFFHVHFFQPSFCSTDRLATSHHV